MLHGILFIGFSMGFPHAAAQVKRKQPSLGWSVASPCQSRWSRCDSRAGPHVSPQQTGGFQEILTKWGCAIQPRPLQTLICREMLCNDHSLTHKERIPVWKRGTGRPAEPSSFCRETTSLCPLHALSWFNASLHPATQSVNNSLK